MKLLTFIALAYGTMAVRAPFKPLCKDTDPAFANEITTGDCSR
jgi:hypothetical protein